MGRKRCIPTLNLQFNFNLFSSFAPRSTMIIVLLRPQFFLLYIYAYNRPQHSLPQMRLEHSLREVHRGAHLHAELLEAGVGHGHVGVPFVLNREGVLGERQ